VKQSRNLADCIVAVLGGDCGFDQVTRNDIRQHHGFAAEVADAIGAKGHRAYRNWVHRYTRRNRN
jgi:hypothetical protein